MSYSSGIMDMQVIISQMAVLFILIAAGYVTGKIKMLTTEGIKTLSRIVLNISTPSVILTSVLGDTGGITVSKTAYFMLLTLIAHVLYFAVALPASRALGKTKNTGLFCAMITFGNVGFMGYPVAQAIFGFESMYYAALFNVVFNIIVYSVGIIMISEKGGRVNLKVLLNATLFASLISFIIVFTGFRVPNIISDALRLAGGINTPCAMLVIGATLSQIAFKDVFSEWRLYPVALLKVIVMPILSWLVFRQFVTDELMLGLLIILSGMPIAAAVAMISIEYGGDGRIASSGIFLTTLISGATIPLMVYVFLL